MHTKAAPNTQQHLQPSDSPAAAAAAAAAAVGFAAAAVGFAAAAAANRGVGFAAGRQLRYFLSLIFCRLLC